MAMSGGRASPSPEPGLGIDWDMEAVRRMAVPGSTFTVA
jgi:L-alanine-DL-glutamate epimerase-like enolase superfamily enzyme